jgi:hypothetical protein
MVSPLSVQVIAVVEQASYRNGSAAYGAYPCCHAPATRPAGKTGGPGLRMPVLATAGRR